MLLYMAMIESEEDGSKFEIIFYEYRDLMYSVAMKILHDDRDAEDAVQESFLKIIKNLDKINVSECHKTKVYIVITIRRTAIDIYRKKKFQDKTVPLDELILDEKYEDIGAQDEIENVKDRFDMAMLINRLPDRYRDVILLKYYNDLSDAEIAGTLGTNEVNVRKILERAKKRLAREYEKGGTVK